MVKVEVNHSSDFNDSYPKNAPAGDAHYSGGKEGSGQPALIYRADVDLSKYFSYYCFCAGAWCMRKRRDRYLGQRWSGQGSL